MIKSIKLGSGGDSSIPLGRMFDRFRLRVCSTDHVTGGFWGGQQNEDNFFMSKER